MCTGGVYAIWSTRTNECLYVGETRNLAVRWRQHQSKLRHHKHPTPDFSEWYDAQEGCKEDSLRFEILNQTDDEYTRKKLEAHWFDELLPRFFGRIPVLSKYYDRQDDNNHIKNIHKHISEQQRRQLSEAQLKRYASDARTTYIGDKTVVGLSPTTQYTTIPIEERRCIDCGEKFYVVISYARQQCQNCWEKNPIRKDPLQYDIQRPDELQIGILSDLTENVLRHEYLVLGLSTCEIAKRYGTSDVTVINRANRWGIPLRSRHEAIESAKEKHKHALINQVNQDLLKLLWDSGVSEKLSRKILNIGVRLYRQIVDVLKLTRPSIRSKGHYLPMTPQLETELLRLEVSHDAIAEITAELEKFRT